MRGSFLLPMTAVLAGILVLGCADQQSPTATADPPRPSLRAEREPIFGFFIIGGDPSNPLALQAGFEAGVTAEDLCANPEIAPATEGQEGQVIFTPPGGFLAHPRGRDVNLIVYQYGGGLVTEGPCQIVGAPILGTGTGDYSFSFLDTGPGAFVFHVTVRGTIDLVSGGQAEVFGVAQVVVRPDGTLVLDEERIRLTPL